LLGNRWLSLFAISEVPPSAADLLGAGESVHQAWATYPLGGLKPVARVMRRD
jgi:hypothetical protein